jgi:hypothetical protein
MKKSSRPQHCNTKVQNLDFSESGYTIDAMKPLPPPPVTGNTEAERFDNAVRKTFTVSKEEIERREIEWQKTHGKKTKDQFSIVK